MGQTGKRTREQKKLTGKMQACLWLVFCLFLVGILIIMIRVLIVGNNASYTKKALQQKTNSDRVIAYQRGDILDRNGTVLAKSERVYHMILDARMIVSKEKYIEPTIRALVSVYGYEEGQLRQLLEERKDSAYYRMKKNMTYEEKLAFETYVKNLSKPENGKVNDDAGNVVGITFEEEFLRVYPFETLASHVIGFAKADGEGTYGIEQQYNEELTGTNGRVFDFYDSNLNVREENRPAIDGNTIVSTIDVNLQRIVQRHVEDFLDEIGADNVGVLMMDVNNGEVLAMQSNYGYDLNNPRDLSARFSKETLETMSSDELLTQLYKQWRNFCINDSYEPGSTFKPFTVASALEENLINKTETFLCNGGEQVANFYISCHNKWGHGYVNAAQSIMQSCNDALMEIAEREGRTVFSEYQRHFLFGQLTGIDLPGEVPGMIQPEERINETELATASFGMGFTTTMIQLGSAFCSMVNGGTYYEPHIVKEIRNSEGVVLKTVEPRVVCNTVSADTSEFLKDAFYLTVQEGTAKAAQVEGYLIGGKTGTAQKLPRSEGKYLVSFIGCVPADKPQVMIYVVVDEAADEELQSQASIASGLAGKILEEVLPYLKIYPDGEINYPSFQIKSEDVKMQEGEIGDTGVVYDPSQNEKVNNVLPDGM